MNNKPLFADVILPLPLAQLFTYTIPKELVDSVAIGKRVVVQFGVKKLYTALIRELHHTPPTIYKTKDILSVIDKDPIITPLQFKFWEWISSYYQSAIGDVYKAAIPSGMKIESKTRIRINPCFDTNTPLSSYEEQILNILSNSKEININDLNQIIKLKNTLPHVKSLLEKNAIHVEEKLNHTYQEKQINLVGLKKEFTEFQIGNILESLKRAPKQQQLLLNYLNLSKRYLEREPLDVKVTDLLKNSRASHSILKALLQKDILNIYRRNTDRLDFNNTTPQPPNALNNNQQKAYNEIIEQFNNKECTLLHGVTSSGKTEIYIHLINYYLKKGQQVLYLLPEIALTTQIIKRLQRVFGDRVGVYHSKFSDAQRVEIWGNIHQNNPEKTFQLILGVRSSIFLPFHNLGLIIIDEEHENTFKQFDPAPRYHARDAAIMLARLHNAKTLLGTATPAIETFYNAKKGKYGLVELKHRYQDIQLPEIQIANTREARRKKKMRSLFTPMLYDNIQEALQRGEQIILFQNRRGFAPRIECEDCGWVPQCKHCDVSLTYHRYNNQLVCHYCGYSTNPPLNCERCSSENLTDRGYGTEKIEEELASLFPKTRIARMDLDTTRSKKSYEKIITDFENHQLDILIGTQMVSKGLDFDNVSIVGIMNADSLLNFPDFRAHERSFQLMSQVAGRAGRKFKQGKVIIQTNDPSHPIIENIVRNDYRKMYHSQLEEREEYIYPPFYRLISITLKHRDPKILNRGALTFTRNLKKIFGIRIFGPQAPLINRIQNYHLLKILLKIEPKSSPSKAKWLLNREANNLKSQPQFKSITINFDVDPL